jgi:hypothetical protein
VAQEIVKHGVFKYGAEEWRQVLQQLEAERLACARAYAEDMDNWSALREEQETVRVQPEELCRG